MADITCTTCDTKNPESRSTCSECLLYLPRPPQQPDPETATDTTEHICEQCSAAIPVGYDPCPYCSGTTIIRFPWGPATIVAGEALLIGRHAESPVASHLAGTKHDNISRRHARFALSESGLQIEDLGSTNGTFVNGERLATHSPVPLCATDLVQLGTDPKLTITIAME